MRKISKKIDTRPNDTCPCGSEKKFKRCCMEAIERIYKGGGGILLCHCVGKVAMAENPELEKMRNSLLKDDEVG